MLVRQVVVLVAFLAQLLVSGSQGSLSYNEQ